MNMLYPLKQLLIFKIFIFFFLNNSDNTCSQCYFDGNCRYCVCKAVCVIASLVCCIAVLEHLPEGKVGGWDSSLDVGMQQAGSWGNYRESTSIPRQDGFLFESANALCVLPGRSLCGLVFTHLPALPVQLKASGCLPNTDRRRLMQRPVKGQPSSCHSPQRSPTLNTHLRTYQTTYQMRTTLCNWEHQIPGLAE